MWDLVVFYSKVKADLGVWLCVFLYAKTDNYNINVHVTVETGIL